MKLKYSLPVVLFICCLTVSCSKNFLNKLPQGAVDSTALASKV